ncbi:Uncharacterised protein [uncultured archaeon]|nr:Uncharacterised protein [uncultured archaeon]
MEAPGFKFVYGKAALLSEGTLAVADLHVGLEAELEGKGLRVSGVVEGMKRELFGLVREEKPERLVIIGDVKHAIRGAGEMESASARELLSGLSELAEVVVVPGNHDSGLAVPGKRVRLGASGGVRIGETAFCHGHAAVSPELLEADALVIGHVHPSIDAVNERGERTVERAWVVAEADERALLAKFPSANPGIRLVVMPAFNPLVGGTPLNRRGKAGLAGPVLSSGIFKWTDGEIFLLDGTGLGSISSVKANV